MLYKRLTQLTLTFCQDELWYIYLILTCIFFSASNVCTAKTLPVVYSLVNLKVKGHLVIRLN